jgi:hypothetical protein
MTEHRRVNRHSSRVGHTYPATVISHRQLPGIIRALVFIMAGTGGAECAQHSELIKPNPPGIWPSVEGVPHLTPAKRMDATSARPKYVIIRGDEAIPPHEVVQSPASRKIAEQWERLSPEERQAILADWAQRKPPAPPNDNPIVGEDTLSQSYDSLDVPCSEPLTFFVPPEEFQIISGAFHPKKVGRPPPCRPPRPPRPRPRPPYDPRPGPPPNRPRPKPPPQLPGPVPRPHPPKPSLPRPRPEPGPLPGPRPNRPHPRPGTPPIIIIRPIDDRPAHILPDSTWR